VSRRLRRSTVKGGESLHVVGRAAYYDPPPHPKLARRQAARLDLKAHLALQAKAGDPEPIARDAIEHHVDAFLLDRRGNADSFALAHRLGREVEQRFGCNMKFDEGGRYWSVECGVLALHKRLGLSPGGPTLGKCSICEAGDFECDHIPGEVYNGKHCFRIIIEWDVREVSFVPFPKDPRCYRVFPAHSVEEVERVRGRALRPGERPTCTHCRDCYGHEGALADDVDQSTWRTSAGDLDNE